MTNQELYKQAILDAKATREIALATARESLAEAFEPRLKEMVRLSLSEDDMEEAKSTTARDDHDEKMGRKVAKDMEYDQKKGRMKEADEMEESMDMEESTLDEILAELDALSEDDTVEEGKTTTTAGYPEKAHTEKGGTGYDEKARTTHGNDNGSYSEKAKSSIHEAEDDTEEDDTDAKADDDAEEAGEDLTKGIEGGMDAGMEDPDQQEVVDITVGDLKDIIRDVFMTLQGGGDEEMDTDTLDLDSPGQAVADDEMGADSDEISLESILAELSDEEDKVEEAVGVPGAIQASKETMGEVKKDLQEAHKAIKAMKHELNEVNLLNAKLLYVNKIFKSKSLNESQKVKVLNAFDRATSVKEVENTYKTLNESIGEASKKSSLKESVGFASKPIGSAPARPIVEADIHVTRWQQLAGIK